MERTKNVDSGAILWRKIGGGSFHATINGKVVIIKPGQVFSAKEYEIPTSFRDLVVPVDPMKLEKVKEEIEEEVVEATKPVYNLKHRGGGWWDVVNEDGKVQNEKSLKKDDAEVLLQSLVG